MSTNLEKNKEIVLNSSYTSFHGFFSPTTILIFIWLAAGTAALFISLLWLPAIYIDGQYIPAGADSFYHARRILDLVTHNTYFQFDPKIHAPEGGLLTWPWAYDYLIGQLVLAIQTIFGISDPMMVIAYIPSAWVYINAAILLGITSLLKLSMPLRLVAVLCFAFLPLTQSLHGAGRIDHHFMEHTMVLLTLFAGINWFQKSASTKSSILFGLVLGFAPGINNGLFVLQIPILATLFILWLKNRLPDQRGAATFGFTLIISTLLLLLPSRAFHE
jgi:hypothetical protein